MQNNDKVVCIMDFGAIGKMLRIFGVCFPVKGEIYSVRDVVEEDGKKALLLHEIKNTIHPQFGNSEPCFGVIGFRPVLNIDDRIEFYEETLLKQAELEESEKELTILNPLTP